MAAPKAPVLGSSKSVSLEEGVFAAEVKPHLVHETVVAEQNAARAGTRGAKSRGFVAGGRAKPWRQKGTGRARAGTSRAPHWTGGGVAFPPTMRSFGGKVNRKARKAAELLAGWGERPTLVVLAEDEELLVKSFRNLDRVAVTVPAELEVSQVVWARSLLVSESALEQVQGRAQ